MAPALLRLRPGNKLWWEKGRWAAGIPEEELQQGLLRGSAASCADIDEGAMVEGQDDLHLLQ